MNKLFTKRRLRPLFIAWLAAVSFFSTSWALSPPNLTADIDWNAGLSSVTDIEMAYNHARRQEENQFGIPADTLGNLLLPSQSIWDELGNDAKALYILNAERTARAEMLPGVLGLPYEGVATAVDTVAQDYAQLLIDNNSWGHNEDGSPADRLNNAYTPAAPGSCREFMTRTENLAVFVTSTNSIPLAVERSIYNWIYDDASSAWGHREAALLQDSPLSDPTEITWGYDNNRGAGTHEGLLGIGLFGGNDYQGPFSSPWNYAEIVVMNIVDPQASDCTYNVQVRTEDLPVPITDNTPNAVDDTATTTTGVAVTIQLADNDTSLDGIASLSVDSGPSSGTLGSVLMDNSIVYSPNSGFIGEDSFTYILTDDDGDEDTATVTITVNAPVNTHPVANDDSASVETGQTVTISVLANDTDDDSDILSISAVGTPGSGSAVQSGDTIDYTPNAGFVGNDSFTYTISDGSGGVANATVNITVTDIAVPDPAVACGDIIEPGGTISFDDDLACDSHDPALTIIGPVKVNMKGHTLTCENSADIGILLEGKRVQLYDGNVEFCGNNASLDDGAGIVVKGSGNHKVQRMHIKYSNDEGMLIYSRLNKVTSTESQNHQGNGFKIINGDKNNLTANRAELNFGHGFEVSGYKNKLIRNLAVMNDNDGFNIHGNRNQLINNSAEYNFGDGHSVAGDNNKLTKNVASLNDRDGFNVSGKRNKLSRNNASLNSGDGIHLLAGQQNTVINNTALDSGAFDLEDDNVDCGTHSWQRNTFETAQVNSGPNPELRKCIK